MENVIAYVFNEEGKYKEKWYFKGYSNLIASFILENHEHQITITDTSDEMYLSVYEKGYITPGTRYSEKCNEVLDMIADINAGNHEKYKFNFIETEPNVMVNKGE